MDANQPQLLAENVLRAQRGDLLAYRHIVQVTQPMVLAVARKIVLNADEAEDVAQETYLRAFRRMAELKEPSAFHGWLRRIAITNAHDLRRRRRATLVQLDDARQVPVLDEQEQSWTAEQRRQLARALLMLSPDERRLCEQYYHGRRAIASIAADQGLTEPAVRKRLQRVRDKLRKEFEMVEQADLTAPSGDLPDQIVELLAQPRLLDLPENPVAQVTSMLRNWFADYQNIELPEIVDLQAAAAKFGEDIVYIDRSTLHRVNEQHVLRYDLSMPMLLASTFGGGALRRMSAGKAYRRDAVDATHLEAFHQAELFLLDDRNRADAWAFIGRLTGAMNAVLEGRTVWIQPVQYPMCSQAWAMGVEKDGRSVEVLACGIYKDAIVTSLGADPQQHVVLGAGIGLERMACLRYDIDDIRAVETATVDER